ncbi:MAG TPA: PQQ-dependent sugar dehydrogenase [Flavipsychrobacter sp.]|nr:PQQ-dependent sugar dehydrogenase [Flavipsychrobacter sp.]
MKKILLILMALLVMNDDVNAQMTVRVVRDSLFIPWELVYGPDNHIWFTQKNGYICRLEPTSGRIDTLYNETNTRIQSEGGMLGLALHPQFATQPYVYVAYNYIDASVYKERIVRYTYNSTSNVLQSPLTLLDNINAANIHNGCRLLIIDNHLYITTGDAATTSNSQNINSLNGKVLRIALDGSIPTDNPIAGSALWSWGHRNAQGMVYANGKLYESEHGATSDDEINIIEKGRNYGWPAVQGYCNTPSEITFCADSNVKEPLEAWTPTLAVCGIDYYDHPMFPQLQKSLLMTTLKDSTLYQLKLNGTNDDISAVSKTSLSKYRRLRDLCISPDGRIYISTSNSPSSGTGSKIDRIIELYDPSYNGISKYEKEVAVIFPNPAKDEITIKLKADLGVVSYSMLNIYGQVLMSGVLREVNNTIDVKALPAGQYNVLLQNAGKLNMNKVFLKQ